MAKFTDDNGITWDIKTTSTQVGNSPPGSVYFAGVDDSSKRDYTGNQFPQVDEDTFPAGTKISWPKDGNPILRGAGASDEALAAIKAFAARQKAAGLTNVGIRVTSSPDAGSVMPLVLLAIVVWYADGGGKKRR